jgi:lipid-binding SYLF domain-containing protein
MVHGTASRILRRSFAALLMAGALGLAGCVSGSTPAEQRATMLRTRDETLETLYSRAPETRTKIKEAAGYLVLRGFSVHPGMMTFASGAITVVDNATGKPTFDRMFRFAVGPGLAIKSHRVVMVINNAETLKRLSNSPWLAGGLLEASFKFGNFGGSSAASAATGGDVDAYYWTNTGFSLEAAVGILKSWHDADMNAS